MMHPVAGDQFLASTGRRFLSILYEMVFLFSILLFLAVFVTIFEYFVGFIPSRQHSVIVSLTGWHSFLAQLFFLITTGFYYTYCWYMSGQTLAMKSWRIKLVCRDGHKLTKSRLWARYFLVFALFPINFFWVFFDKDRQFLHDRWCKTMLILV
ncbi:MULTISPECIES: RDD family protein [Candidatus Ichthyocystis]|uniref:Putative RDD family transmembrane protein n=1 Tax=Candidatus Ichthyocystis hellenicum TaxID=1561003 RepID=A0A0S4M2V0_9BURK|nr:MULTISPECIES: RDD family protein [Ichthyocystis]CUT18101.1 putative RDD family transmembrane protein [Candidatus Ichthyocystis hellenicum]